MVLCLLFSVYQGKGHAKKYKLTLSYCAGEAEIYLTAGGRDTTVYLPATSGTFTHTFTAAAGTDYVLDFLLGGVNLTHLEIQELCTTLPSMRTAYKYRYNGKEQLSSFQGRYDYGFRMYDAGVARFLSVDPLTKKYPELTPYQFASNTPIQAIDLDGLEAFFVHGTWSDPSTYSKLSKQTITNITKNTEGATFQWSGNNTDIARQIAGKQLAEHVMKNRDGKQSLTIVGHSHGGNVAIIAANILKGKGYQVDNLITFNTPVREYQLDKGAVKSHLNVSHSYDFVQLLGGGSIHVPKVTKNGADFIHAEHFGLGEYGIANTSFNAALNVSVPMDFNDFEIHNSHNNSTEYFSGFLKSMSQSKKKIEES